MGGSPVVARLDLDDAELGLAIDAAVGAGIWLVAAALLHLARRPPEPPVGEHTLDLGPEPPAVANFLLHDWRVTDEGVPATLIDLAARGVVEVEQRGPGVFYIRLRGEPSEQLTAYEKRVLDHLRRRAVDGVVPAEAITTGAAEESTRWRRGFEAEVVADAKARGLSRDAFDGSAFTILTAAALVPALLVAAAASAFEAGVIVMGAAIAILGWIRARHPQRETPAGMASASRWLGVRAELASNEVFETHSPLTVALWDRLLAYGAALGVASGASGPLTMGTESETVAWSAYSGRWRPVRVSYPRRWPPAWGSEPLAAMVGGLGACIGGALVLFWLGPPFLETAERPASALVVAAILAVPCAAVVIGLGVAILAFIDNRSLGEVTGPILRLRAFESDDETRYFVAVDDGSSRSLRAWRISPSQYAGLRQGETVTVWATPYLGRVRSIAAEPPPALEPAGAN